MPHWNESEIALGWYTSQLVQAMAQAPAGEPVSTDREGNSDVRFGVVSLKLYSLEALLNGVDFK